MCDVDINPVLTPLVGSLANVAILIAERDKLNRVIAVLHGTKTMVVPPTVLGSEAGAPKKKRHISAATRRKMALGQQSNAPRSEQLKIKLEARHEQGMRRQQVSTPSYANIAHSGETQVDVSG